MDKAEIERYLFAGRGHSVVVDAREVTAAPGVIRTLTVHRGNRVTLEFDSTPNYITGDIEGWGPKYVARYLSLNAIIDDLEEFLGHSVAAWTNRTAEPLTPSYTDAPDTAAQQYLEDLVRRHAVELPRRATYALANIYWRHISKYGEYREDKLEEEQDEHLGLRSDS